MPSQRVYFENSRGHRLAGIVDLPDEEARNFAVFSHCFTCTKDLKAIVRISRGLAKHGIGVLRFDFTGLGDSHGVFAESNIDTNLDDIQAAVRWVSETHRAPELLIGHSLGGAAIMASANRITSAKAIVTVAAPSCTLHLAEFLARANAEIESTGKGAVVIGGRTHLITTQLLESLRGFDLKSAIKEIAMPHLVIHSPSDETLEFRHAEEIFALTGGPKSLVTLDGADHLLVNQPGDVAYVANLIATWSSRFL